MSEQDDDEDFERREDIERRQDEQESLFNDPNDDLDWVSRAHRSHMQRLRREQEEQENEHKELSERRGNVDDQRKDERKALLKDDNPVKTASQFVERAAFLTISMSEYERLKLIEAKYLAMCALVKGQ